MLYFHLFMTFLRYIYIRFQNALHVSLNDKRFSLRVATTNEVQKALSTIKSNAVGYDGINLKILEFVVPFCFDALTRVINSSIEFGILPSQWNADHRYILAKNC